MKQPEIESMFDQIYMHRIAIGAETKDLNKQVDNLLNQISDIIQPHEEIINALKTDIRP